MQVGGCFNKPCSRAPNKPIRSRVNLEIATDKTSKTTSRDFSCGGHLLAEGSHRDFIKTKTGHCVEERHVNSRPTLETLASGAADAYQTGIACSNDQEFWKALESFQLALQFETARESLDPICSSNIGNILRAIGETQMKLQLLPEAMVSFKKACQVTQLELGPHHIDVAETILSIGQLHHMNGEYKQALSACERVIWIDQILGLGINLRVEILLLIGAIYDDLGQFDFAINQFHLCLDLLRNNATCEMKAAKVFALHALCTLHIKKVKSNHAEGSPNELCKLKLDEKEMFQKIQQDMVSVLDSKK